MNNNVFKDKDKDKDKDMNKSDNSFVIILNN